MCLLIEWYKGDNMIIKISDLHAIHANVVTYMDLSIA